MCSLRNVAVVILLALFPCALAAQTPVMLHDQSAVGSPVWFKVYNGSMYFIQPTAAGSRLFKSDGTPQGTVVLKDIGAYSELQPYAGQLYFNAFSGKTNTPGLWKTNGTNTGTVLVKSGAYPTMLATANNLLFFRNRIDKSGQIYYDLYKSNGTSGGTALVKKFSSLPGPNIEKLTDGGSQLFFRGKDAVNGWEWWRSDGTSTGTFVIRDIYPGSAVAPNPSFPGQLFDPIDKSSYKVITWNNQTNLYATCYDGTNGWQIWKTDGTFNGTSRITSVNTSGQFFPHYYCQIGGTLYFSADGGSGYELWKMDLSTQTTSLVADLNLSGSSYPAYLTAVGTMLYFTADDGVSGRELWKYSGSGSPQLAADINSGSGSSNPNDDTSPYCYATELTHYAGKLYFSADNGISGQELWKYDGSAASLIADINTTASSNPDYLTVLGSTLFFRARNIATNYEPWALTGLSKSGAQGTNALTPSTVSLQQNYPNPFNPSTEISFNLPLAAEVTLIVTDALGREVARLIDSEHRQAGTHSVAFDARDLPSGLYLYRLETASHILTRKMLLMR